jgi:hypothetical protein
MPGRNAAPPVRFNDHSVSFGIGKHLLVEYDKLNTREIFKQEASNRCGVVYGQQLGGKNQTEAPAGL